MESGLVPAAPPGAVVVPKLDKVVRFGRYWLIDRIATGGMAEVYRAVSQGAEGFRRTFIIKRILTDKASSPEFKRMFCDEARISALLHHPNIAQVYDFGYVAGSYFLAMEYLPGRDLASVARVLRATQAAVPPGLAAYVAREAALGLYYAHTLRGQKGEALGIVHRDVTPSNIMLLFEGGVKLLDFGIAKSAQAAAEDPHVVKGKLAYLAPEQARGEDVDGRADVFALGVTLWEMLVGRRLFAGKDDLESLRNVLEGPVPPPSSIRPQIPTVLDRIVLRALERDRAKRYATAEELASECDAVLGTLRADRMTLRAFLKDLFAAESTSLTLATPELPERLSEEAVPAGSPARANGKPPAPPIDVIATADITFAASSPWSAFRVTPARGAVLAAAMLIAAGLALHGRVRPTKATIARSAAVASPAPPPLVELLPRVETGTAALAPDGKTEHRGRTHRRAGHLRKLPADLTLNPF